MPDGTGKKKLINPSAWPLGLRSRYLTSGFAGFDAKNRIKWTEAYHAGQNQYDGKYSCYNGKRTRNYICINENPHCYGD